MAENQNTPNENEDWITAPDAEESRITAGDVAKGAGRLAAEVGGDLLQTLLSLVILAAATVLGLLIGFFIDGGSLSTIGIVTVIGGVIGLVAGFIINAKRGHSVFFF